MCPVTCATVSDVPTLFFCHPDHVFLCVWSRVCIRPDSSLWVGFPSLHWGPANSSERRPQQTAWVWPSVSSPLHRFIYSYFQISGLSNKCNGCMPVRAVCKPYSKRGALQLGRAPASRAGIPGSRPALCDGADPGGYVGAVTRAGVRFRGGESNGCMPVRVVCKPHSPDLKKRRSSDWR